MNGITGHTGFSTVANTFAGTSVRASNSLTPNVLFQGKEKIGDKQLSSAAKAIRARIGEACEALKKGDSKPLIAALASLGVTPAAAADLAQRVAAQAQANPNEDYLVLLGTGLTSTGTGVFSAAASEADELLSPVVAILGSATIAAGTKLMS